MAKYIYAQQRLLNVESQWYKDLYLDHINVLNGFFEPDGSGKNTSNKFINRYNNLLDEIHKNGFDEEKSLIPVGKNNLILDGAHRIAACLLYNFPVTCLFTDTLAWEYNPIFFKFYEKHVKGGLDEDWIDAMVLQYCRLKRNIYVASVFPSAEGNDDVVVDLLSKQAQIIYKKDIEIRGYGQQLLIRQMYSGEQWIGGVENKYLGARQKAYFCFSKPGPLRILFLETDNKRALSDAKEKIRKIFNVGKHSIHINDYHEETIRLSEIYLNKNSISFLNLANSRIFPNFDKLFKVYKKWIGNNEDKEKYCIDGSSVMAVYGIREAVDIDFIVKGIYNHHPIHRLINCHNEESRYYPVKIDDIIFNPKNHFYFDGVKFSSLNIVQSMKINRNEKKDRNDVELIEKLLSKKKTYYLNKHQQIDELPTITKKIQKSPKKIINCVYSHTLFNGYCTKKDDIFVIWSKKPIKGSSIYYFQDAFSFHNINRGIKVLGMHEPITVLPQQYSEMVWKHFDFVFTTLDDLVAGNSKFVKIFHPAFDAPNSMDSVKSVKMKYCIPSQTKKIAICMIAGNKESQIEGELYSKRLHIAKWFQQYSTIPFDVYGRPPFHQLDNYCGILPTDDEKYSKLSSYRYSLCFENIYHSKWSKGYLTEKILHCLMCGTVPIYLGCSNIENYIPRNCFIDFRDFSDLDALDSFLGETNDDQYQKYIVNIRKWIEAGNLDKFSMYHIYDKLASIAFPDTNMLQFKQLPWKETPISKEFNNNQLETFGTKRWFWKDLSKITCSLLPEMKDIVETRKDFQNKNKRNPIVNVIFSKNRALQLNGTIQSFLLHCKDAQNIDIKILYTTTSNRHEEQYSKLKKYYPEIQFIKENNFKKDLENILSEYLYVMFNVDDNIYIRDFSAFQIINAFNCHEDILGCTLRLGQNTIIKLHPVHKPLQIPKFKNFNDNLRVYNWTTLKPEGFGYPCELQSAVYRVSDIGNIVKQFPFRNPNTLEALFDKQKGKFSKLGKKNQLCFAHSVCFSNPINLVQSSWNNWSEGKDIHSIDALAQKFDDGYRIDVERYEPMTPVSSHQVVNLLLTRSPLNLNGKTGNRTTDPDNWCQGKWRILSIPDSNGMVKVNGVQGFLTNGDMVTLSKHAAEIKAAGTVVEIGSFMGLSAIVMGHALRRAGNCHAKIHCVDTWDSSYLHKIGINTDKSLIEIFKSNIKHNGLNFLINLHPMASIDASSTFKDNAIDLLFIDGDHCYESCYQDLSAWYPKVKDGGIILGHDCRPGGEVIHALEKFVKEKQIPYELIKPPVANFIFKIKKCRPLQTFNSIVAQPYNDVRKNKKNLTSILIVNHNGKKNLEACLASIRRNTFEPYEIIVVDNASTDVSKEILRNFEDIILVENSENIGCPQARAQGLGYANGEVVIFLDNDTVVTPSWLSIILSYFKKEKTIGLVGPLSNFASGPQWVKNASYRSWEELDDLALKIHNLNKGKKTATYRLVGFCMAIRRDVIDKIGSIDSKFGKFGFEDDDYTLRAIIAGFSAVIARDLFIHHTGGPQTHGDPVYNKNLLNSWNYFKQKWNLPPDLKYGTPFDREKVVSQPFNAQRHFIPLQRPSKADVYDCNSEVDMHGHISPQEKHIISHINTLHLRGKTTESINLLKAAMEVFPDSVQIALFTANLMNENMDYALSETILRKIPDAERNDDWFELMAYSMEGQGTFDRADELINQALAQNCKKLSALLNVKAVIAFKLGKIEKAEYYLRNIIQSGTTDGRPYSNLGMIEVNKGNTLEGLHLIEQGFSLSPQIEVVANNYHHAVTAAGAFKPALQVTSQACRKYPISKNLNYLRINILLNLQLKRPAMCCIENAIAQFGLEDGITIPAMSLRNELGPMVLNRNGLDWPSVSLCMIVKNEVDDLPGALESFKNVVSEIIIVDTGSVDETKIIAEIFGATVLDYTWKDNFADARNESLVAAKGEWILVVDADERLSPTDQDRFIQFLLNLSASECGYSFVTRNYVNDVGLEDWRPNHGEYPLEEMGKGWCPSTKVRLFPNSAKIRFENSIHELVEPSLREAGYSIQDCLIPIHHYGKLKKSKALKKKKDYFRLGLKKKRENGETDYGLVELAIQAGEVGDYDKAVQLWQRVLENAPNLPKAHFNLSYVYIQREQYQQGLEAAQRAVNLDPNLKEAQLNKMLCKIRLNDPAAVVGELAFFLEKFPNHPMAMGLAAVAYCLTSRVEKGLLLFRNLEQMAFDCGAYVFEHVSKLLSAGHKSAAKKLLEAVADTPFFSQASHNLLKSFEDSKIQVASSKFLTISMLTKPNLEVADRDLLSFMPEWEKMQWQDIRIIKDRARADFVIFPFALDRLYQQKGHPGMLSFLRELPGFDQHEDRYVFFFKDDIGRRMDIRSVIYRVNHSLDAMDLNSITLPYFVEDIYQSAINRKPRYQVNFVGTLATHLYRAYMLLPFFEKCQLKTYETLLRSFSRLLNFRKEKAEYIMALEEANTIIKQLFPLEKTIHGVSYYFDIIADQFQQLPDQTQQHMKAKLKRIMNASIATLCPRGVGTQSIRFFETMAMGRLPVVISDRYVFPLNNTIDYDQFVIRIKETRISQFPERLAAVFGRLSPDDSRKMGARARQVWSDYFSPSKYEKYILLTLSEVLKKRRQLNQKRSI
ncbi:glycosyltransferase [Desulfosarcina ovata]|nr:glycosyltransferase [Desulfosarcina ovata]